MRTRAVLICAVVLLACVVGIQAAARQTAAKLLRAQTIELTDAEGKTTAILSGGTGSGAKIALLDPKTGSERIVVQVAPPGKMYPDRDAGGAIVMNDATGKPHVVLTENRDDPSGLALMHGKNPVAILVASPEAASIGLRDGEQRTVWMQQAQLGK